MVCFDKSICFDHKVEDQRRCADEIAELCKIAKGTAFRIRVAESRGRRGANIRIAESRRAERARRASSEGTLLPKVTKARGQRV